MEPCQIVSTVLGMLRTPQQIGGTFFSGFTIQLSKLKRGHRNLQDKKDLRLLAHLGLSFKSQLCHFTLVGLRGTYLTSNNLEIFICKNVDKISPGGPGRAAVTGQRCGSACPWEAAAPAHVRWWLPDHIPLSDLPWKTHRRLFHYSGEAANSGT